MCSKQLLSIKEAENYLGVSLSTLYRWHCNGKLIPDCRTIGLHRRYKPTTLDKIRYHVVETAEKVVGM